MEEKRKVLVLIILFMTLLRSKVHAVLNMESYSAENRSPVAIQET